MARAFVKRLSPDASGSGWWLSFGCGDDDDFDHVVETIKRRIPVRSRRYDRLERAWWIASEEYLRRLVDLLPDIPFMLDAFADARRDEEARARERERERRESEERTRASGSGSGSPPASVAQAFATLHLLPSAPIALVGAARRVLALDAHPDHGGDHQSMVDINNAADRAEAWLARHAEKGARP